MKNSHHTFFLPESSIFDVIGFAEESTDDKNVLYSTILVGCAAIGHKIATEEDSASHGYACPITCSM